MNKGKMFENNFKKSLNLDDENIFFYRFKDGTASWEGGNNTNVRFQQHNMADCMIFHKGKLIICELKAHAGKSLPLSCIRDTQYKEMLEASYKNQVYPFVIIFFYDIGECYGIKIEEIRHFLDEYDRKSIPLMYIQENGIKIDCELKRTQYKFNLDCFLSTVDKFE